jgi:hypothetical protein
MNFSQAEDFLKDFQNSSVLLCRAWCAAQETPGEILENVTTN